MLGPKSGGVVAVVLGAALMYWAWAWWGGPAKPYLLLMAAVLGPTALVMGVALLVLPPRALIVPKERDGRTVYETKSFEDYTPLGLGLAGVAVAAGVAFAVWLKYGQ